MTISIPTHHDIGVRAPGSADDVLRLLGRCYHLEEVLAQVKFCCQECFCDPFLKEFIASRAQKGCCTYCGAQDAFLASTTEVGHFLRQAIEKHFEGYARPESYFEVAAGNLLSQHVLAILRDKLHLFSGQLLEHENTSDLSLDSLDFGQGEHVGAILLNDLLSASAPINQHHDLLHAGSYSEIQVKSRGVLTTSWEAFKHYTKHYGRYFSQPSYSREKILQMIAEYFPQITTQMPSGSELWRSRIMQRGDRPYTWGRWGVAKPDEAILAKLEEDRVVTTAKLGPPPLRLSKNNRMSPEGISYTYLSVDKETCCSEIGPQVGDYLWSGQFETLRSLTILDLNSSKEIRPRSLFCDSFIPSEVEATAFLSRFAEGISAPIKAEDSALDYVPSQVFCEFVRSLGYDGISFRSSLFDSYPRANYVLFCGPSMQAEDEISSDLHRLPYFADWLRLRAWQGHTVTGVQYQQHMAIGSHCGGDFTLYE